MSSSLEAILKHDGRLDLLCCLLDGGPLGVPQVAARIVEPVPAVHYWARQLESFGLVEKLGDLDGKDPLYAVTLDEQPAWVRKMIDEHRDRYGRGHSQH